MSDRSEVWRRAHRILAVRLDAMGDVLMTTPAIRALRESGPGRTVSLLTSPSGAAAGRCVPEIDECLVYEPPWMKATPPRVDFGADRAMIDRLRDSRFDGAVIFTVYSQNSLPAALFCTLADIPLRLAHCRENPYQLLTDWVPECEPECQVRHEVRRQLDLVGGIGCTTHEERLSFRVPEAARRRVADLLHEMRLGERSRWAVVHPGSTAASRRYPPELFAEVTARLVRDEGIFAVFTGSGPESELVNTVRELSGVATASLAGRLELPELAALLERAPVLLANNTGPVHLAAAVRTPVVDLYALTNPQHTPWGVPSRILNHPVPCSPCYRSVCVEGHHDCLRRVGPESVVTAVLGLMKETTKGSVSQTNRLTASVRA